ncbi:hypothetical protein V5N11_026984 [Cardamine amara subsp. amara]|uniref:Uncharacterized protein n=1 Tax=Cardamine amara subsp. amara TaxID=228776 RepID=A0ABD1BGE4_CARAN
MVKKLGLEVKKHHMPYDLQWINEQGEMKVKHQVEVPIVIGQYEDEVLCDILPMEAGHILLGIPWQSDRRVMNDGYTNRHTFEFKGRKTTLVPMSPHEVYLDQIQLKGKKGSGKKPNLFAMAGKTLYDDPFDPKTFAGSNRIACYTNLAPVLPSDLLALQILSKDNHQAKEEKHHHRTELQDKQESQKKHVTFKNNQVKLSAKHFAYDGEKTLYIFEVLDEHQTGTKLHVQTIDISNLPGYSKLFKIIFNGFKSMIVQLGPVVNFFCTNHGKPHCIHSNR